MTSIRWLETDTLTNQNISSALEIGSYTADADRQISVQAFVDAVAGNGDYVMYVTLQIGGSGSAYVILPKTTMTAASGETAIGGQSGWINVRNADVVKVYVDGLAGDTTTPDTTVRWFEDAAIQPTTADRTLDVSAGGEAGIDWANVGSPTTTVGLSGTTVKTATDVEADTADIQSSLANGTYGLSALEALVDDLESRLTAARAGYLDSLNTGVMMRGYTDGSAATYFKQFAMPGSETGLTTVTPGGTGWARYAGSVMMGNAIGAYRILSATDTTLTLDRALLVGGGSCVIIPDNITSMATSAEIAALNNLSAAQVNAEMVDALATDVIADSIPADGSRGRLTQSIYMILQLLTEGAVSGTTWTVKKPDGSTALFTMTLDSATAPTSKTRSG